MKSNLSPGASPCRPEAKHILSKKWLFKPCYESFFISPSCPPVVGNDFSLVDFSDKHLGFKTNWRELESSPFEEEILKKSNCAWYIQDFTIPDSLLDSEKIFICFERVYLYYSVWINGNCLGECFHGYFPCTFDLSDYVQRGETNSLAVYVGDATTMTDFPIGALSRFQRGISGNVYLIGASDALIENIFIKTSVQKMRLDFDVSINCFIPDNYELQTSVMKDGKKIELDIKELDHNLSSGCLKLKYTTQWDSPEIWEPGNPVLYNLDVQIKNSNGNIIDHKISSFGFREFRVVGPDFLLNEQKIRLRVVWGHITQWENIIKTQKKTIKEVLKELKNRNINCVRFHCQPFASSWLDAADEMGMMLIIESALNHLPVSANSFEHFKRLIIRDRNHPAVIIWSGSNEFEHWKVPRDENTTDFLLKIQELAHSLDPTRPVQHSAYGPLKGKEDIINIHYPVSEHTLINVPEVFNWLENGECPNRLNSVFTWQKNKPLVYGEQLLFGQFNKLSAIVGDKLYEEPLNYKSEAAGQALAQAYRWCLEENRKNGVAMISAFFSRLLESPYGLKLKKAFEPIGVCFKNRCTQFFSGEKCCREIILWNDNNKPWKGTLVYRIGKTPEKIIKIILSPGSCSSENIILNMPNLLQQTELTLSLKLINNAGKLVTLDEYKISVSPRGLSNCYTNSIALYSFWEETKAAMKQINVPFKLVKELTEAGLNKMKLLLIGGDIADDVLAKNAKLLRDFTAAGNSVIVLSHEHGKARDCSGWLPLDLKSMDKPLTISFPMETAECFDGIGDKDLRFWGMRQRISEFCYIKPISGNYRVLADAGSIAGLNLTPLLEISNGNGQYVVSSYLFIERLHEVPAAGKLLSNLIEHYSTKAVGKQSLFMPAAVICESDESLFYEAISQLQIEGCCQFRNGIDLSELKKHKIWLVEDFALLVKIDIIVLKDYIESGLTILCNSFSAENLEFAQKLIKAGIHKIDYTLEFPLKFKKNSLTAGIKYYDTAWLNEKAIRGCWRFNGVKLEQGFEEDGILQLIKIGQGGIIFNNIAWDEEVKKPLNASSFFSMLLNNIGVKMKTFVPDASSNEKLLTLDISEACNRNMAIFAEKWIIYQDLNQENENLCYNQQMGKLMPKMAHGALLNVDGIPFKIIDPRRNQMKNAIVIYDENMPEKDLKPSPSPKHLTGLNIAIPREQSHMKKIFFLHTAAVNWRFKQENKSIIGFYQINYYCGKKEKIPIIMEYNIGKFKTFSDQDLPAAKLAACLPGPNGNHMCFYMTSWTNNNPQEKIMGIELLPGENLRILPILLGISFKESEINYI